MKLKKGDFVKCIECPYGEFTVGEKYEVKAGAGDADFLFGGIVGDEAFITTTDRGSDAYCLFPACEFGKWEIL